MDSFDKLKAQKDEIESKNAALAKTPAELRDETIPGAKWEFDQSVTDVFGDMLARSIPQHDVMRKACFDLGCRFVQESTAIVDLGCSRGDAMAPFVDRFGATVQYVGVETSPPMLEAARRRFQGWPDSVVQIKDMDLRHAYPPLYASLTLAVLTLQFIPIEHRHRVVRNCWKRTAHRGALIVVEKVLGSTSDLDDSFVGEYHNLKRANGYSQDQIDRKRLALEGVLVPVTAKWNEEMLWGAGFKEVDCFWRWMNFAGWIALKD